MKPHKETNIKNVFTIDTIITMYHLRIGDYCRENATVKSKGYYYDFWQLIYLDSGIYSCEINGKIYSLKPGQLIFCEPNTLRLSLHHKNAVMGIISFRSESESMQYFKDKIFTLTDDELRSFSRILTTGVEEFEVVPKDSMFSGQQVKDGTADYELQFIKNHFELFLIDLYAKGNAAQKAALTQQNQVNYYEQKFRCIEEFLQNNLNRSLSISEISAYTNFSATTIKRICCRQINCGPIHYFLTLKINEAKRLIRETDMNITQIAESLGFSDVHYFSRIFKNRTGMPPTKYAASVVRK